MRIGIYDLEGNYVEYDGEIAYDADSASEIDLDYLEIMGKFVRPFEEGALMKVIRIDNYDRGIYAPVVIAENLTESEARRLADQRNDLEDEYSPDYYMVVEDDWQYDF